jgi:hypothetical protein
LVLSLVKVNKSYYHVTQELGGGGEMTPNVTQGEEGSKKDGKIVTYYLNVNRTRGHSNNT